MSGKFWRRFRTALVLSAAVVGIAGCAGPRSRSAEDPLRIGVVLPLSGEDAQAGKQILDGIRCAHEMLRRDLGKDVQLPELVVKDDRGQAGKADAAVRELADRGVAAVLVGYRSSEALAVKSAAAELKLPILAPTATNDGVTARNPYMFRASFSDSQQAKALAYYARYRRRCGRMGVLLNLDENAVYSRDLGRQTAQEFVNFGGRLAGSAGFRESMTDFRPQLRDLLAAGLDVLFVPAYPACAGRIVRQARELGYRGLILGGDGWNGAEFLKECGKQPGDVAFSAVYSPDLHSPAQEQFVRLFQELNHRAPSVNEALGFEAMMLMFMATREAYDSDQIRERFAQIRSYPGVSGEVQMTADGDSQRNIFINIVEPGADGKLEVKMGEIIAPVMLYRPEHMSHLR